MLKIKDKITNEIYDVYDIKCNYVLVDQNTYFLIYNSRWDWVRADGYIPAKEEV